MRDVCVCVCVCVCARAPGYVWGWDVAMTSVEQELFVVVRKHFNVTLDLCGCLPGNISYAPRIRENYRRLHLTVKLIKRRIRK